MRAKAVLLALLASPALSNPVFAPVSTPEHVYAGDWEHFVGGGLAAFDCSGDGLPDLFAAGGTNPAQLLRNQSTPDMVVFAADTPDNLALTGVTGAYPIDIDNDGILDLAVLRVGQNMLLRGGPDCSFAPFDAIGFQSGDNWTTAFSAMWESGNTLPTLAFGNYVDRTDPAGPFRACDAARLYRPENGIYGDPVPLAPGHCALSMLFSDWAKDGRTDLRISNDRHYYVDQGQEQLWRMGDPPHLYGPKDGWQEYRLWGMGIAARDLDGDGWDEVFLTSMGDQRLHRLQSPDQPIYADVPFATGITAHRPHLGDDGRPSTGWHAVFGDVTNDGFNDLFITKGNVDQMPDSAWDDPNNLLIGQQDGRFAEAAGTAGVASLHRGRGAALMDFNNDGLLDLAVVNRRAPMEIWQNVSEGAGSWLGVTLAQSGANTHAAGARIELRDGTRTRWRDVTIGGGHASGTAGPEHFGLGSTRTVRLRVHWPDGVVSEWHELATNQSVTLRR